MSNRSDVSAILADIDDTISRVRDLSTSPERAAALQCLADARRHLARAEVTVRGVRIISDPDHSKFFATIVSDHRVERAPLPSVPPSCSDNQRVRSEADEAFRESRRILREVLR